MFQRQLAKLQEIFRYGFFSRLSIRYTIYRNPLWAESVIDWNRGLAHLELRASNPLNPSRSTQNSPKAHVGGLQSANLGLQPQSVNLEPTLNPTVERLIRYPYKAVETDFLAFWHRNRLSWAQNWRILGFMLARAGLSAGTRKSAKCRGFM